MCVCPTAVRKSNGCGVRLRQIRCTPASRTHPPCAEHLIHADPPRPNLGCTDHPGSHRQYAPDRRLLSKATVALYEDVTDFFVADDDGAIVGCGALHVMWEDLAEVRTLAVLPHMMRRGSVHRCSPPWSDGPQDLGVSRVSA